MRLKQSITNRLGRLCCICVCLFVMSEPLSAASACTGSKVTAMGPVEQNGDLIRSAAEFSAALRSARGGETLLLSDGNFGVLKVGKAFTSPVTIRSADPSSPACFTDLRLDGAANVTLAGLVFDYAFSPGDKDAISRFNINKSRNIIISDSVFDGDYKAGIGHGRGLHIKNSVSVTLSGNVFRKWWKAVTGSYDVNLALLRNQIYDIRADGMMFTGIEGLRIEGNWVHSFRASSGRDHRDMLQITRSSNRRSTDIVIRDNIFDMGAGDYTQTIFMGKSGKNLSDPLLRHQNVLIENNVIYNAHTHGISVTGADNLSIRKNSVIRVPLAKGGKNTTPRINVWASTYVVIEQNVVSQINGNPNQPGWAVLNNAIVQNTSPSKPGYYDREFIYYATGAANGYNEYGVRPGSQIDRLNAGSTLVKQYPTR